MSSLDIIPTAYNLICSADENQWQKNPTPFPKRRVFEYSEKSLLEELESSRGELSVELLELPTLFMYEDMVGRHAHVGKINSIQESDGQLLIRFQFDDDYHPLTNEELHDLQFELDIHPFQFSRSHWSVKHVDLLEILDSRGKRIPKQSLEMSGGPNFVDETAKPAPEKTKVFISYSHADVRVLDRLRIHLKPLEEALELEIWSDNKLVGGDDWKSEIDMVLSKASVAILVVSADFLASDFVIKHELPPLLKKYEKGGCRIIPIIAKPCFFSANKEISRFQSVNDPKEALLSVGEAKQEEILSKVAQLVNDLAYRAH